jgi:hypothetical protein
LCTIRAIFGARRPSALSDRSSKAYKLFWKGVSREHLWCELAKASCMAHEPGPWTGRTDVGPRPVAGGVVAFSAFALEIATTVRWPARRWQSDGSSF